MFQLLKNYLFCSNQQQHSFLSSNEGNSTKSNNNLGKMDCQTERSKNRAKKTSLKRLTNKAKSQKYLHQTNKTQDYSDNSLHPSFLPLTDRKFYKNSQNSVAQLLTNNSSNKSNGFQASFGPQRKCLLTFQRIQDQFNTDDFVKKNHDQSQSKERCKISCFPLNNLSMTEDCSQPRSYKQSKSTQQFLSYDLPFSSQTDHRYLQRIKELNKSPQLSKDLDISLAISVQPDQQDQKQVARVIDEEEGKIIIRKHTSLEAAKSFISSSSQTSQQESFVIEDQEGYLNEFRIFLSNQ